MAKTKAVKAEVLSRLDKIFSGSKAIAFVNFHKLTVKRAQELRRKLRENGTGYFVAKKTLIRKALEGKNASGTLPPLEGEIGVAYLESSEDITAPAREGFGFQKKFENAVRPSYPVPPDAVCAVHQLGEFADTASRDRTE